MNVSNTRNWVSFFASAIITLLIFYAYQSPKEGNPPTKGFNLVIQKIDSKSCYHIHHWVYMVIAIIIIIITMFLTKGSLTMPIMIILGALLGGILSDVHYKDFFKFKIEC